MSPTIAEHVFSCLESFKSFASVSVAESEGDNDSKKPEWRIGHELSRFKVWSGNIGAHQRGKSSLDYRLRDASHLSSQVKNLLKDLKDALDNASSILNGTKIPWDQELFGNERDDESISGPDDDDIEFPTEMDQISVDVIEVINCLMNLSVSIRNPAPRDRFRGSMQTDTSFYEPADIAHVQAKCHKADPNIIILLGKANTRRRQYFKYRESHHQKLSRDLDIDFDTSKTRSERQSTVASSIPHALKTSSLGLGNAVDVDELSDSGFTQTSYVSSANTSDRPRFPGLPSEAANGPFQCPFCFTLITVTTSYAWRKHIFADLRPYICMSVDCPIAGTEFGRRHHWMQHMLDNHWREWRCAFCVHEPFTSTSSIRNHLQYLHAETIPQEDIETVVNICEHPSSFEANTKCPLCHCSLGNVRAYRHHVGRHLEDIALFVLPHIPGEDGLSDNDDSINSISVTEPGGDDSDGIHETKLPSGQCRYILLDPEIKGHRCGCVGFTLNRSVPGVSCECGHLSIYHIKAPEQENTQSMVAGETGANQIDTTNSGVDVQVGELGDGIDEELKLNRLKVDAGWDKNSTVKERDDAEAVAKKEIYEEAAQMELLDTEAKSKAENEAEEEITKEGNAAGDDQASEEARKKEEEAWKRKALAEVPAEVQAKEEASRQQKEGKDKGPIRFKDAINRKFSFPFHLCQNWTGMEQLIKEAFLHVDVIGPHVQAGHYDLLGPDKEIILPQVWDKVIEPDWQITMVMWPMVRDRPNDGMRPLNPPDPQLNTTPRISKSELPSIFRTGFMTRQQRRRRKPKTTVSSGLGKSMVLRTGNFQKAVSDQVHEPSPEAGAEEGAGVEPTRSGKANRSFPSSRNDILPNQENKQTDARDLVTQD